MSAVAARDNGILAVDAETAGVGVVEAKKPTATRAQGRPKGLARGRTALADEPAVPTTDKPKAPVANGVHAQPNGMPVDGLADGVAPQSADIKLAAAGGRGGRGRGRGGAKARS